MKYSAMIKTLAIILAACALAVAVVGSMGMIALSEQGLYETNYNTWVQQFHERHSERMARAAAESYAARTEGNLSPYELLVIGWGNSHKELSEMWNMNQDGWGYDIMNTTGGSLETVLPMDMTNLQARYYAMQVDYPVRVMESADWEDVITYWRDSVRYEMFLDYRQSKEYMVKVWITEDGLESFSGIDLELFEVLYALRWHFVAFTAAGLLLFLLCMLYLCWAAGKSPKRDTVEPGGLNKLPLDLYSALLIGAGLLFAAGAIEILEEMLLYDRSSILLWGFLAAGCIWGAALCVVLLVFAHAAQWKLGFHRLWQRTLIGWCFKKVKKVLCWCYGVLCKLYGLLPLIWRYLLVAFLMVIVPLMFLYLGSTRHSGFGDFCKLLFFVSLAADAGMVLYGAYAYGTLLKGARRMAEGELNAGIDTKRLYGSYRDCAVNLNAVADVAILAAKKQMRSERMKTELITNVSHDIKTPLTSVINYIDLLQKAQTPEQREEYLAVLERQSQKLKKLIGDLMEMSKATTGDLPVELTRLDGAEALNQALGEFADKLTARNLTVVLRMPEESVPVMADGQLTWRVLSNLMGNIVKYALPGTRVYADLTRQENRVLISLKNISEQPLNISADELTERFVRGDASRNTEGSGLGLHIAKSLMELQKGSLELQIDGDLFKVTLTFPTEG